MFDNLIEELINEAIILEGINGPVAWKLRRAVRALEEADKTISELQCRKVQKLEPWVVCFCCRNKKVYIIQNDRRIRVCHKCGRNSFAPCGMEKDDWFNKNV